MLDTQLTEVTGELGLKGTYAVLPSKGIEDYNACAYWEALENADTLKYRFSDIEEPTWQDIMHWWVNTSNLYGIIDCGTGRMVADMAIDTITGKAGQLHFSMHPNNDSKVNLQIATFVVNMVLNTWRQPHNKEESYLDTLFGLIAVSNRAACIFTLKAGFKKLAVIPNSTHYLGKVEDAMLNVKTLENSNGR